MLPCPTTRLGGLCFFSSNLPARIMHQHLLLGYIVSMQVFYFEVIDFDWLLKLLFFYVCYFRYLSALKSDLVAYVKLFCFRKASAFNIERSLSLTPTQPSSASLSVLPCDSPLALRAKRQWVLCRCPYDLSVY